MNNKFERTMLRVIIWVGIIGVIILALLGLLGIMTWLAA
ncbi:MAG: hypothetical protein PWR19_2053 [Carnobacterium sp.]|nr:hypothetical protein [Carnobacterium sp.]